MNKNPYLNLFKIFGVLALAFTLIAGTCDGGRSGAAPAVGAPTLTLTPASAAPAASLTPVPTLGSGAPAVITPVLGLTPHWTNTPAAPAATLTPVPAVPTATSTPAATIAAPGTIYALPVLEIMKLQTFPETWNGLPPHSAKYGLQYQPPTQSHRCNTILAPADPLEYPACLLQEAQAGRMTVTQVVIATQRLTAKYGTPNFEGTKLEVPNTQASLNWFISGMKGTFRPDFGRPLMDTAADSYRDNLFILSAGSGGPNRIIESKDSTMGWTAWIY